MVEEGVARIILNVRVSLVTNAGHMFVCVCVCEREREREREECVCVCMI